MSRSLQHIIVLLRISLGGLFFYSGLSKILEDGWTAQPILLEAQTFPEFFAWFASSSNINWVDFANKWGLLLIGISLIIGLWVRFASLAGITLMILYYLVSLNFPIANVEGYIIDKHIIYLICFLILYSSNAGYFWGLENRVNLNIKG